MHANYLRAPSPDEKSSQYVPVHSTQKHNSLLHIMTEKPNEGYKVLSLEGTGKGNDTEESTTILDRTLLTDSDRASSEAVTYRCQPVIGTSRIYRAE